MDLAGLSCSTFQNYGGQLIMISGVCESLPVQLVNDIFFIHERGKKLGYYTRQSHPFISWEYLRSNTL